MRVLFITHSFPRAEGDIAGAFVLRLAVALRAAGIDVRVLAPSAPGLDGEAMLAGVPVSRFRYAPGAWETLAYEGTMAEQVRGSWRAKVALLGFVAGARRAVAREMRDRPVDVVHAHWWFPSGLAAALAPGDSPLVVTMHGSDVRLAAASRFAPVLLRFVAWRTAAFTAVSRWLADGAGAMAGVPVRMVAPMPVDASLFSAGEGARRTRSVLLVGRLNAQKGVRDVIDALGRMALDVTADVVGDGPDRAGLERFASERGVAERIRWHGALPQRDVARLYAAAGVVAIPSREEGLGLVAVEAQLCGAPVVAYRSGGLTDVVEDGRSGLLVEPGDIAALAGALTRVLDDRALASRLAETGRGAATRRFSPTAAAAAYAGLYHEVTG